MPIKGAKYAMKKTSKGNVRLAFVKGKVVEAKNMETGDTSKIKVTKKKVVKKKGKK